MKGYTINIMAKKENYWQRDKILSNLTKIMEKIFINIILYYINMFLSV